MEGKGQRERERNLYGFLLLLMPVEIKEVDTVMPDGEMERLNLEV